jgi:hypothetical protein
MVLKFDIFDSFSLLYNQKFKNLSFTWQYLEIAREIAIAIGFGVWGWISSRRVRLNRINSTTTLQPNSVDFNWVSIAIGRQGSHIRTFHSHTQIKNILRPGKCFVLRFSVKNRRNPQRNHRDFVLSSIKVFVKLLAYQLSVFLVACQQILSRKMKNDDVEGKRATQFPPNFF